MVGAPRGKQETVRKYLHPAREVINFLLSTFLPVRRDREAVSDKQDDRAEFAGERPDTRRGRHCSDFRHGFRRWCRHGKNAHLRKLSTS